MPGCTPAALAKRALVTVLLSLAAAYNVALQATRDSEDAAVRAAFRKVVVNDRAAYVRGDAPKNALQCDKSFSK